MTPTEKNKIDRVLYQYKREKRMQLKTAIAEGLKISEYSQIIHHSFTRVYQLLTKTILLNLNQTINE